MSLPQDDPPFRLRSYQAEMVEESLRANLIVVMDTGSGKTHIALSRTVAELENCQPEQVRWDQIQAAFPNGVSNSTKRVWFLAPTGALCQQQFKFFQSRLPGYNIGFLDGQEADRWSDQSTWDTVLRNVRVVVSTYQVLLDALNHAFVRIQELSLLIFDEAHHCGGEKHPANRIMTTHYRPLLRAGSALSLPRILGLSASPVIRAQATGADLQNIESILNSVSKTPKLCRSELLRIVNRPELSQIVYHPTLPGIYSTPTLDALENLYRNYNISTDPYVIHLKERSQEGEECSAQLHKAFMGRKTYCFEQLKSLVNKARAMRDELGPSPTEWYLQQCITKYEKIAQSNDHHLLDGLSRKEKEHLAKLFRLVDVQKIAGLSTIPLDGLSPKVNSLVDALISEASAEFTGIIFAEQRAWVTALYDILSTHPLTKSLFRIRTFVGTSNPGKRKVSIWGLAEALNEVDTLEHFRAGKVNLVLATSVLEEGIDIPSCHLVICFEKPKNLKSFIQRRGRARRQKSKLIVFTKESEASASPEKWESLENEMKEIYMNDLREAHLAEQREDEPEEGDLTYTVPTTGALLTVDTALSHLHHFCSTISSNSFIDPRPQFTFKATEDQRIIAEVTLPLSVDPSLRNHTSAESWRTERMAKNGAAFQAYKALHLAGLVNDNLLPQRESVSDEVASFQIPDNTPALVNMALPFDPWVDVARAQHQEPQPYYRVLFKLRDENNERLHIVLMMPWPIPGIQEILLHWNETKDFSIETSALPAVDVNEKELVTLRRITWKILSSALHGEWTLKPRDDFLWLLAPSDPHGNPFDINALEQWDTYTQGQATALEILKYQKHHVNNWGLINIKGDARKFILGRIMNDVTPFTTKENDEVFLPAIRMPKRRDFLHKPLKENIRNEAYSRLELLNLSQCLVDRLPAIYSIFALFVPAILHKYELAMTADNLRTTILTPVEFQPYDASLIIRAMTSSKTAGKQDYQRLEFLGDCILKLIASVHLMAAHSLSPESYLTGRKGKIVCNGFLARATKAAGLDRYIITKRFTGKKWAPIFAEDVKRAQTEASNEGNGAKDPSSTLCSSKILADVIESLIGASYIVGGFPKAFACMQTLLPLENWTPISSANEILFLRAPDDFTPGNLSTIERLLGHTFNKKLVMLEALTHGSYTGPISSVRSYERLEFLGDAILDYIVSNRVYSHEPELHHKIMHGIRTAIVNAAFLTFRMCETTVEEEVTNPYTLQPEPVSRALWQFLRYSGENISEVRDRALAQHTMEREGILAALGKDERYPWHLLARIDAPKFLSDIVESVIGAVYVDTQGDLAACERLVRRFGILDVLEDILRRGVDCLHPKERLAILAVEKTVDYVEIDDADSDGGLPGAKEDGNGYTCQVKVGGVDVGGAVTGLKKLNAETIAAWRAVQILEGRKREEAMVGAEDSDDEIEDVWYDAQEESTDDS